MCLPSKLSVGNKGWQARSLPLPTAFTSFGPKGFFFLFAFPLALAGLRAAPKTWAGRRLYVACGLDVIKPLA